MKLSGKTFGVCLTLLLLCIAPGCSDSIDSSDDKYPIAGFMGDSHWSGSMKIESLSISTEENIRLHAQVKLPKSTLHDFLNEVTAIHFAVVGERIYDENGISHRWSNSFGSTVLTSTGLPIETYQFSLPVSKLGHPYGSPLEFVKTFKPEEWETGFRSYLLEANWSIPAEELPAGYYRLHTEVFFEFQNGPLVPSQLLFLFDKGLPLSWPLSKLLSYSRHYFSAERGEQPIIKVGNPARPKLIWTLFTNQAVRGSRGLVAKEDRPHFALTNRFKFPGKYITSLGEVDLTPSCPIDMEMEGFEHGISTNIPRFIEPNGKIQASIEYPSGKKFAFGPFPIEEYSDEGPVSSGPLVVSLSEYGRYTIQVTGTMKDRYGWEYDAGGTYQLWVAEPLTFSTSVKPGSAFSVGNIFPNKVVINPPVPAQVRYDILHLPHSLQEEKQTYTVQGTASKSGLYLSTLPKDLFRFEQPGEYLSELTVMYRDQKGKLYMGAQTSAGVVADKDNLTRAHGKKHLVLQPDLETVKAYDRYNTHRQGKFGDFHSSRFDCVPTMLPYWSGDILYVSETLEGGGNISNELSLEAIDPEIRDTILDHFPRGAGSVLSYLYRNGSPADLPTVFKEILKGQAWYLMFPFFDPQSMSDMLPLLSATTTGYHPYTHPETKSLVSYYYMSAIRPGLVPKAFIADSTAMSSYWMMNGNRFDDQINAGLDGDLDGDLYRFQGGTVYRDIDHGTSSYSAYSSVGIVEASGKYNNRVTAPFAEPLITVNNRDHWAMLGIDPALIAKKGDIFPIAGLILPTMSTAVEITVTAPDGSSTVVDGNSKPLGAFITSKSLFRVEQAGVYKVHVRIQAGEKTGDLLGSGDGIYHLYSYDPHSPKGMQINLPPMSQWDPNNALEIPIQFDKTIKNKKLSYSLEMPGILMDEGSFEVNEDTYTHWFSPRQFRRQFQNYDWPTNLSGEVESVDTVLFVFFLEAEDANGQRITQAEKIAIRKNSVFNMSAMKQAGHQTRPH